MDRGSTAEPGARSRLINGTLKKHQVVRHPPPPPPPPAVVYSECLKNHAASLGGHAVDGCGEFMPSPAADPADPSSLRCAACGCHRNFHRRVPFRGSDDEEEQDDDDGSSGSPPPASAPHMLMALRTGGVGASQAPAAGPSSSGSRKRSRTRFSPEQKERMQELSERLGWRMQRRDEQLIEERCREIGVGKGVFKVWMHNNKHNFVPPKNRGVVLNHNNDNHGNGDINNSHGSDDFDADARASLSVSPLGLRPHHLAHNGNPNLATATAEVNGSN